MQQFVKVFTILLRTKSGQPVRQRINQHKVWSLWEGENRFRKLAGHPYEFFETPGETLDSFRHLFEEMKNSIPAYPSKISPENKLAMTLV